MHSSRLIALLCERKFKRSALEEEDDDTPPPDMVFRHTTTRAYRQDNSRPLVGHDTHLSLSRSVAMLQEAQGSGMIGPLIDWVRCDVVG